ncbi:MAG: hypothetical protein AABY76_10675 [Planctomycetota bacterium]
MKKESLSLLLGYLTNQMELLGRILKEVADTNPTSKEKTSHLAYLLHNLYCALEDVFQEIAKTFENRIEDPSKYHRELLNRMQLDVPEIRPKLLSRESRLVLDELRGFRHVFRHAYDFELDPEKVKGLKHKLIVYWARIEKDVDVFTGFLQNAAGIKKG